MGQKDKMEEREELQRKGGTWVANDDSKESGERAKGYEWPLEVKNSSQMDNWQGNGDFGTPTARN